MTTFSDLLITVRAAQEGLHSAARSCGTATASEEMAALREIDAAVSLAARALAGISRGLEVYAARAAAEEAEFDAECARPRTRRGFTTRRVRGAS